MRYVLTAVFLLTLAGCRAEVSPPTPPPQPAPAPPCDVRLGFLGEGGVYQLLDCSALDDAGTVPAEPKPVLREVAGPLSYSADRTRLAYVEEDHHVFWADLATGGSGDVGPLGDWMEPVFAISPDGKRVALPGKGGLTVWTAAATGQPPEVSTVRCPKPCESVAWSPDSQTIALGSMAEAGDETNDGGIWVTDGPTPPKQLIAPGPKDEGCSRELVWSPDGQWLAWSRGYGDAWTGDLARSDGSDLRRGSIAAGPAEWLPDSRGLLVRVHVEAGAFSLGLYSLEMEKVIPLPTGPILEHALTPDGKAVLAFPGQHGGMPDIIQVASGAASGWSHCAGAEAGVWLSEPPAPNGGRPFPWRIALAVRDPQTKALRLWLADGSGSRVRKTDITLDQVCGPASLAWVNVGAKP